MEHVVFFPAPDGTPAFRRVAALEDAVRLVEHLRNVEGVHEVSVHPIGAEVPLAFRTWYRVEVPAVAAAPVEEPAVAGPVAPAPPPEAAPVDAAPVEAPVEAPAAEVPAAEPVAEVPAQPAAEAEPVAAGGNGHRDVTSLGFFAT